MMQNLIGLGIIAIGIILFALTQFVPLTAIMFIGVFLFASFQEEEVFVDYIMANTNVALARKRRYMNFLPFYLVSLILTFGRGKLLIVWGEEYYKVNIDDQAHTEPVKISRKEYVLLRNEQRRIYATQLLSKEFMERNYNPEIISFKRKKNRLIAASVFAAITVLMIFDPTGWIIGFIYAAVFVPMVLLWFPTYKDAKILQNAYDRSVTMNEQLKIQ